MRLELPLMAAIAAYGGVMSRAEAATIHGRWMRARAPDYSVHLSARLFAGYAMPAAYYVEALAQRGPVLKAFVGDVFSKVDVIVSPTILTCLPTLAETDIDHGPPGTEARFMAVSAGTRAFNYLGLPAVSASCGFDPNGCPIGLHIAGRPFAEGRVLRVAEAYQRDTLWHAMEPQVGLGG